MSTSASTRLAEPGRLSRAALYPLLVALAALLGVSCAVALQRYPVGTALLIAGGAGLLIALALAVARYDAAVAVGFVLMAVVRVEPAPPDALFAVVISVALLTGRFDVRRVPLVVLASISAFLLLNLLSAVEAVDPGRAASFFGITLYLCVFSVWFTTYLHSVREARLVLLAYLAAAVGSAILGTLALLLRFPGSDLFIGGGGVRAQALFEDPNVYGPFLIPAALIVLEESVRRRLLKARPMVIRAIFLVLCVGVLFSYSRAAWVNLVVGSAILLVVLASRRRSGGGALGLLLVLALTVAAVAATVVFTDSATFLEERAQVQSYDTDRFDAQRRGVAFGEQRPLGIGPGQFEIRAPLASHSIYIRVFAEQGVLGAVVIATLILATSLFALRNAIVGRDTYGIGSAALLGAWCGILANSFVIDTLHWRHLWMVAALVWVGAMRRPGREPPLRTS